MYTVAGNGGRAGEFGPSRSLLFGFADVLKLGRPASVVFIEPEVFRDLPGSERRRLDVIASVHFGPHTQREPQRATFLVHVEVQSRRETTSTAGSSSTSPGSTVLLRALRA